MRHLLIEQKQVYQAGDFESQEYIQWKAQLLEAIPHLNHDVLVTLALHLAFDAKLNDAEIWRNLEDAAYPALQHLTLT